MKKKMAAAVVVFFVSALMMSLYLVFADADTGIELSSLAAEPEYSGIFSCDNVLGESHEVAVDINYKSLDEKPLCGQEFRRQIISCLAINNRVADEDQIQYYIEKRKNSEEALRQSCYEAGLPEEFKQKCLEMSRDSCQDN